MTHRLVGSALVLLLAIPARAADRSYHDDTVRIDVDVYTHHAEVLPLSADRVVLWLPERKIVTRASRL